MDKCGEFGVLETNSFLKIKRKIGIPSLISFFRG
jgi:hypothetical protein